MQSETNGFHSVCSTQPTGNWIIQISSHESENLGVSVLKVC